MNSGPVQEFFVQLTSFVSGLDLWQQILALLVAGAIPFIESYLGAFLGVIVGINPVIAIVASIVGNIICTFALIALASGARNAVVGGRPRHPSQVPSDQEHTTPAPSNERGPAQMPSDQQHTIPAPSNQQAPAQEPSKMRQRIAKAFHRYGVPGASLLGPLVIASQITAPTLVALGASKRSVYLWMGVSIIVWGVLFGVLGGLFVSAVS